MSYRQELDELIISKTGLRVMGGPFRGLHLTNTVTWSDGDISPKLLGVYEKEVLDAISRLLDNQYDAIINIGSADGYYAVGLARLIPDTPVYCYEINEAAHPVLKAVAQLNNVAERVVQLGACEPESLSEIAFKHKRMLVVCDCEGYEKQLFADDQVKAALAHSDIIIECHDLDDPEITGEVLKNLMPSHFAQIVYSGARNPNVFGFLSDLHDRDRWLAVSEGRWKLMHWLVCEAKSWL